ncbi:MAG: hypothetical protein AB7R55_09420 [Gemmatimonadales bacterium]
MRVTNRAVGMLFALTLAASTACGSGATEPTPTDRLAGRWEGTSGGGVAYVYVFGATGQEETNPRTGGAARTYDLAYTTTPGGSGSVTAWYEGSKAYWGNSSVGTIVNDTTMMVEAAGLSPFPMHKRP